MTTDITKAIERAKELDRSATPGLWRTDDETGTPWNISTDQFKDIALAQQTSTIRFGGQAQRTANARFIAESRTILPQLVAEVERLRAENDDLAISTSTLIGALNDATKKLEQHRPMPEWRPLSVLPFGVKRWPIWALTAVPVSILIVPVITDGTHEMIQQMVCVQAQLPFDKDPSRRPKCRPVDREGVPVPWSEVGL